MKEQIDIISFCKILTDLTNKDKCEWIQTSHVFRDRLDFKSGYLEITQYGETSERNKTYVIDFFGKDDSQYVPFMAEKGVDNVKYEIFGNLYKSIWSYYERKRNEKINTFLEEIMEQTSK